MKAIYLVIVFIVLLSCEKNNNTAIDYSGNNCIDNNPDFVPEEIQDSENYKLVFYTNSSINVFENEAEINNAVIEPGKFIVFQYRFNNNDDPLIADDEYTEILQFEIDPELERFTISGNSLKQSRAVYGEFCFCLDSGFLWITDGCIKGKKINSTRWQIEINISAKTKTGKLTKMLSGTFDLDKPE